MVDPKKLELDLMLLGFKLERTVNGVPRMHVYLLGDTRVRIYTRADRPNWCRCTVNCSDYHFNDSVIKRITKDHVHV